MSLENKKCLLCLIVSRHSLPPAGSGPHSHQFYSLLPDPVVSLGSRLKCELPFVIYGPCDAKVRTQIVLQTALKPLRGAGDSSPEGQFAGYGTEFAPSGTKGHRISITRQANSHCFLPAL